MDETPNLALPYILSAQAQKHVTHNEALRALDTVVQLSVMDQDLTAPTASPTDGDRYIVASGGTGEWSGKDGQIAAYQDNAWMFHTPHEGWLAWVDDEDGLRVWDGAAWIEIYGDSLTNPTPLVGVYTTADTTNRLAVKSDAVLFSHDDVTPGSGDIQTKLNKAAAGNNATFLFQDNWSGRAEIGLAGDDDFHFKVSPDGSTWHEGIIIDKDNGHVGIKTSPDSTYSLVIDGLIKFYRSINARFDFSAGSNTIGAKTFQVGTHADLFFIKNQAAGGYGTGGNWFQFDENADNIRLMGTSYFTTTGLGVGVSSPSTTIHVNDAIRFGSFTVATVPSASARGAGSQIYVSNETGGAQMAFSDGSNWRRMTDRAIIS